MARRLIEEGLVSKDYLPEGVSTAAKIVKKAARPWMIPPPQVDFGKKARGSRAKSSTGGQPRN